MVHSRTTNAIAVCLLAAAVSTTDAFSPQTGRTIHKKVVDSSRHVSSIADLTTTTTAPTTADATTDTTPSSTHSNNFIYGLSDSPLQRPKGRTAVVVADGDSTETQPYQVALVTATMLAHSSIIGTSVYQIATHALQQAAATPDAASLAVVTLATLAQFLSITVLSWLAADLGSGVFHWSVDNYGNGRTPVLGSVIAAFQGHHAAPWTITERSLCNNVYKLCLPFGIGAVTLESLVALTEQQHPTLLATTSAFMVWVILSQEFHKWSHMPTPPRMGRFLQQSGISVGKVAHTQHHREPFAGNYCIVSGVWNEVLDTSGVFRVMERMVYQTTGVEANTWKLDPELRASVLGTPDDTCAHDEAAQG